MVFLLRSRRCRVICRDALLKQRRAGIRQSSSLRLLTSTTASQQVKWNSTLSSHHHVDDDSAPSTSSSAAPHIQQPSRCSSEKQLLAQSTRTRVAVAMSGGVDSSVTAYLLQQMSKSSSSHQQFVDGSNNTSTSVNQHGSNSSNNMTAPKESSNPSLDIIGLHMSNWNALDEDSDENLTNTKSNRRRKHGQKMSKGETVSNTQMRMKHDVMVYLNVERLIWHRCIHFRMFDRMSLSCCSCCCLLLLRMVDAAVDLTTFHVILSPLLTSSVHAFFVDSTLCL